MKFWYALQCHSGREEQFRKRLRTTFGDIRFFLPRRQLEIRRQNKFYTECRTLFPGYIFFETDSHFLIHQAREFLIRFRDLSGSMVKILGMDLLQSGSDEVQCVKPVEMQQILDITDENEIVQSSGIQKEGKKVIIQTGPLAGKDALIVRLDVRKKRARVKLNLFGQFQQVDLGIACLN